MLIVNNAGFASGSTLGIDTTGATGGFSYGYAITGSMGLTSFGPNTLTLSATNNSYTGGTTVHLGTLAVTNVVLCPATAALPASSR